MSPYAEDLDEPCDDDSLHAAICRKSRVVSIVAAPKHSGCGNLFNRKSTVDQDLLDKQRNALSYLIPDIL